MSKSYTQIIEDLEKAIRDIEAQGISIQPLNKALENLKTHSDNIEAIEKNIDAVKSEVINPIKNELEENKRAGKFSVWGFYIGIFGLVVTAVSLLYTTFGTNTNSNLIAYSATTKNSSLYEKVSNINSSIKELNYSINGLKDTYKPQQNDIYLKQLEEKSFLSNDSNKIFIKAYLPGEVEYNSNWIPKVSLSLSINDNQIGIIGLKDMVKLINNSGIADYNSNQNSIELSENDEFIFLEKYKYKIQRIFRTKSQILSVCDKEDAVVLKLIYSNPDINIRKVVVNDNGKIRTEYYYDKNFEKSNLRKSQLKTSP